MTDTTDTERELRELLSNVRRWHAVGTAPHALADGTARLLDTIATLRARVEELEGTLDYERTGHAHIAKLVDVSEWDPQAVCDAIIRERAKVEAALEAAQNYLRTTSLALSQAGQRAIEREDMLQAAGFEPVPANTYTVGDTLGLRRVAALRPHPLPGPDECQCIIDAGDQAECRIHNDDFNEYEKCREPHCAKTVDPSLYFYCHAHQRDTQAKPEITPVNTVNVDLSTPWGRPEVVMAEREAAKAASLPVGTGVRCDSCDDGGPVLGMNRGIVRKHGRDGRVLVEEYSGAYCWYPAHAVHALQEGGEHD